MIDITFLEEGNRVLMLYPSHMVISPKKKDSTDSTPFASVWISVNKG